MSRNSFIAPCVRVLSVCAFLFTAQAVAAPGATSGQGSVSASGAATYSIPIRIPNGINGFQPAISLNYHSRAGVGHAGQGWSLGGIPEIRRCGKFFALDGKQTGVALTTADRFCLNGERLVSGSGTYGANNATYYTEVESYAKVTSYTSGGSGSAPASGPQWFKVETSDGLIYEYGKTTDSRVEPVGTTVPLVWAVNRITDPNGNYIDFTYLEYTDKGVHYPREIRYTGTTTAAPIYSIYFTWPTIASEERVTTYIAGASQRVERRLSTIQVRHNGSDFRRYNLAYESSTSASGLSRLASVQECAGSDCLAATDIEWHTLTDGMTTPAQTTVTNKLLNSRQMDVDGDGRKDLVYESGGTWRIMFAESLPGEGIVFGSAVDTSRSAINPSTAIVIDFNGDGRSDLLYVGTDSKWHVLRSNGTGFSTPLNTQASFVYDGSSIWSTDINGDGLDDIIYARDTIEQRQFPSCEPGVPCYFNTGYVEIFYRLNNGSGFNAEVKARQIDGLNLSSVAFPAYWSYRSTSAMPDFNGDGIADLMILLAPVPQPNCVNCDDPNTWTWWPMKIGTGSFNAISGLESLPYSASPLVLDINGDGNSDLAYADAALAKWRVYISNGSDFRSPATTSLPSNAYSDKAVVVDINNDGRDDIVMPDAGYWRVARSTGTNFLALDSLSISWQVDQFARVADFDGDGDGDLLLMRPSGSSVYWRRARNVGEFGDKVHRVTDGLGNGVRFSYGSSADIALHTPLAHSDSSNYIRVFHPYSLVSTAEHSDGNGGYFPVDYEYYKGRRDRTGRGFQGFDRRYVTDMRNNTSIVEYYHTAFPLTGIQRQRYERRLVPLMQSLSMFSTQGFHFEEPEEEFDPLNEHDTDEAGMTMLATSSEFEARNAHIINRVWLQESSPLSAQGKRILLSSERERRYINPGTQHYDFTTDYSGYDAWGNATSINYYRTVDALNHPSVEVSNTYSNSISSRRCPGKLTASTSTYSAPGQPDISQHSSMTWDSSKCRPLSSKREPGDVIYGVTQTYAYDLHGNVASVTESGANVTSRTTSIVYEPLGYRQSAVTNALNQTMTASWDPTLRTAETVADAGGNTTVYEYDNFDRITKVTRADGSYATTVIANCSSTCDSGRRKLTVTEKLYQPDGAVQGGRQVSWLDGKGRVRYTEQRLLGSVYTKQRVDYDSLGNVNSQSLPFTGSSPTAFINYTRDYYGRPVVVEMPGEQGQAARTIQYLYARSSSTTHQHYIRITDPEGKSTTRYFDTLGRPTKVRDALGMDIVYGHDAAGRLIRTTDPSNNITNITYDLLGHRTSLTDPNLGAWSFTHNVFGELVSQTDAKNQTTTFTYDKLGRIKTRVEPEGTSTWTYDAAPGAGIGKLHKIVASDYTEEYVYDALGRPSQQKLAFDSGNYQYDFAYDAFSRLSRITYPESVTTSQGNRFAVLYGYNISGALSTVTNANDMNEVFWQASDMNAFGQVTTAILGNDVTSVREFDPNTGRLKTLRSFANGQPEHWNLNYEYSLAGNVTARENSVANLRETFTYDDLYRLNSYSLNGSLKQSIAYDTIGNITSKSDAGSYTYGSPRPHAVTAIGATTYQYDANGNMTDRGSTTIDWNSANLATQISQGGDSLSFHYGPNRQRYKQTASIGGQSINTHYIGGLMEAIGANGVAQYRHSIVAAGEVVAQHTRDSDAIDGNPRTVYTQRDMLGSIGVITDQAGAVIGNMHFDPWGKRIDAADWDGNETQAAIDAVRDITHRGFTSHEMLDAVNLVHMNGRIYDPNLGRMLSADPVNSEPSNLQRYNRYSYVNNQPLSFTDPTGLDRLPGTAVAVYWLCRDACDSHSPENREGGGGGGSATLTEDDMVPGQTYAGTEYGQSYQARFALPVGQYQGLPAGGLGNLIDRMNARVTPLPQRGFVANPAPSVRENSDVPDGTATYIVTGVGAVASYGEYSRVYNGEWRGANGKWNSIGWGGNGVTGGRNGVQSMATKFEAIGRGSFYFNTLLSVGEIGSGFANGDVYSIGHGASSGAIGYISTFGGWPGLVAGLAYTAVDMTFGWRWAQQPITDGLCRLDRECL